TSGRVIAILIPERNSISFPRSSPTVVRASKGTLSASEIARILKSIEQAFHISLNGHLHEFLTVLYDRLGPTTCSRPRRLMSSLMSESIRDSNRLFSGVEAGEVRVTSG